MRPVTFSADPLRQLLRMSRIATLPQLKQVLGTDADITVFRKLKDLSISPATPTVAGFIPSPRFPTSMRTAYGHSTRFGFRAAALC